MSLELMFINDCRTWFYGFVVFDLVMLILAIATVCIDHARAKKNAPKGKTDEEAKA